MEILFSSLYIPVFDKLYIVNLCYFYNLEKYKICFSFKLGQRQTDLSMLATSILNL